MKKLGFVVLFALTIPLLQAAPTTDPKPGGPPYHLTTVSWVVETKNDLKVDDRYVSLIGRVTKRLNDDSYLFSDGTGSIQLDCPHAELPVGAKVVIGGRIDQAYLGIGPLEINVREWRYCKKP